MQNNCDWRTQLEWLRYCIYLSRNCKSSRCFNILCLIKTKTGEKTSTLPPELIQFSKILSIFIPLTGKLQMPNSKFWQLISGCLLAPRNIFYFEYYFALRFNLAFNFLFAKQCRNSLLISNLDKIQYTFNIRNKMIVQSLFCDVWQKYLFNKPVSISSQNIEWSILVQKLSRKTQVWHKSCGIFVTSC